MYIGIVDTANDSSNYVEISNVSVKQVNGNPAIMINLGGGADFSNGIQNGSPYANLIKDVSKNGVLLMIPLQMVGHYKATTQQQLSGNN